ncbi:Nre family DNA repair protein [Thermofilum pendens]|uniref:DNA repair protein n=1 Tax=Thermofilum pendens (strain DSM 2475 / Hrk 5) TaxID=368408 RepID=A1S146_THEPD|nr:Nre family DNA repair protein [Thermofilum pendens]ABL79176.1 Protein of unknown function DUF650, N-terminal domain [Thermofilum pendens Hrk 5]
MGERAAATCLQCRGAKRLCGKSSCPVLDLWLALERVRVPETREIDGYSPPTVFVGRHGYPEVRFSVGVPSIEGDPALFEDQERWLSMPLRDVIGMRLGIVRGEVRVKVDGRGLSDEVRLAALSSRPVDVEILLEKAPRARPLVDLFSPPLGPAGPAAKISVLGNPSVPRSLEKAYYDYDLGAREAIYALYREGVPVHYIQRALSVGALGLGGRRRIVPTRWAITAVDSTLSQELIEEVKRLDYFDEYLFFERKFSDNTFVAIIAPGAWSYEWIEAWFPHTTWNPSARLEVEGDWEGFKGRTTYASLGGCYYAARLATAEFMLREKRQGTAILLREIYEGFFLPIGVWFVRENVRELFRSKPERYESLEEVLRRLEKSTRLPLGTWLAASTLLRRLLRQSSIEAYIWRG